MRRNIVKIENEDSNDTHMSTSFIRKEIILSHDNEKVKYCPRLTLNTFMIDVQPKIKRHSMLEKPKTITEYTAICSLNPITTDLSAKKHVSVGTTGVK